MKLEANDCFLRGLKMKRVTRRQILGPIGIVAGSCVLTSCLSEKLASSPDKDSKPTFPWVYAELDPDITAQRTYYDCEKGHCMYGIFAAVMSQLAEKRGEPYKSFPVDMMRYGVGGTGGWGSLCGALNGSAALVGLFAKTEEQLKQLVDEVFLWYEQTELPVYAPKKPILDIEMPKSVSNSVLCHVSATKWCEVSGHKAFTKPQKERCKRITADTAKKTVEILNAHFAGRFTAARQFDEETKRCRSCHTKDSEMQNSRGKTSCMSYHTSFTDKHPDQAARAWPVRSQKRL